MNDTKDSIYTWLPTLFGIIALFAIILIIILLAPEWEYRDVSKGCIVSAEWQPESPAGYGHVDVDWGWFYVTDTGYVFKSQEVWTLGTCIEVTERFNPSTPLSN